jgi:hypothetical protein
MHTNLQLYLHLCEMLECKLVPHPHRSNSRPVLFHVLLVSATSDSVSVAGTKLISENNQIVLTGNFIGK